MNISTRAQNIPASPIRRLVPFAEQAKQAGKQVYHLNIGQPDIETPPEFMKAIHRYAPSVISYAHSRGIQESIDATLEYYRRVDIPLESNQILITTGGSEALQFAMAAVCDPQDEIIIFEPTYTNYLGFSGMLNVTLVPCTTQAETGYHLPEEQEITRLITPKTKAILICNPNNPTGTVFTKDELAMLATIAKERDLFLISDEVYREFTYDNQTHTSIMQFEDIHDRAILTDSLSKRFSLCGARVGSIASRNPDIMDAVLRMAQTRLSSPSLEQLGSIGVLDLPGTYYQGIISEYQKRRDVVYTHLRNMDGVICKEPKGAFYVFVKLPIDNCNTFCQWMLTDFAVNQKTVMVAPGDGFYATKHAGLDEIRIAYVLKEADLNEAMEILAAGVQAYNSR
jgi:aspartate aminotransferase